LKAIEYHSPPQLYTQLLSREAEGPALRSLGNPAALSNDAERSAKGAKSGRQVLEDERLLTMFAATLSFFREGFLLPAFIDPPFHTNEDFNR
jgi:hypothetical protein